ncbi:helix-turn-helix domain-containing protein, partial [Nostoc sp. CENA67]|nr:helix-turn-helix domain-containing protein [Amazonocrinis nigriterrae CENA67]
MGRGRTNKIRLSAEQRQHLEALSRNGHAPVKKILHARVLIMSDEGEYGQQRWNDQQIGAALGLHRNSVARIRSSFLEQGEQAALNRKPRQTPPVPQKLDGEKQAHLIAICCSPPPDGRTRWTMKLLVDELKARSIVTQIGRETVRCTLKKTNCARGKSSVTVFP